MGMDFVGMRFMVAGGTELGLLNLLGLRVFI